MSRLEGLQQDNASLEHEIAELHNRKAELMKQIEKTRKKRPLGQTYEQLKKVLLLNSPTKGQLTKVTSPLKKTHPETGKNTRTEITTTTNNNKRRRIDDDYVPPEPIQHEFFDQSIAKYFTQPKKSKKKVSRSDGHDETVEDEDEKVNKVILENVYRMFGITAFPVKDPSRSNLAVEPELLGIRIEIFNELDLRFETPHYIILEKNTKNGKWIVFKHTVPSFVQLYELADEYDGLQDTELLKFLRVVRDVLNKTSWKHQVMEKIKKELYKNVQHLQKDIAMENLKFTLVVDDKECNVIMKCLLDSVVSCSVENGFSITECERISKVLKGDFTTLQNRLESVIESMAEDEV